MNFIRHDYERLNDQDRQRMRANVMLLASLDTPLRMVLDIPRYERWFVMGYLLLILKIKHKQPVQNGVVLYFTPRYPTFWRNPLVLDFATIDSFKWLWLHGIISVVTLGLGLSFRSFLSNGVLLGLYLLFTAFILVLLANAVVFRVLLNANIAKIERPLTTL